MDRKFWPVFVLAGFYFTAKGFPASSGIDAVLDLNGLRVLSQLLAFCSFCGIALALANDKLDLYRAVAFGIIAWLVCAAVAAGLGGIGWLLSVPVVAWLGWNRDLPEMDDPLGSLPDPLRAGLAALGAILGGAIFASGMNDFRLLSAEFDYFEIWTGTLLYAAAVMLVAARLERSALIRTGISAYILCLALFSLTLLIEIATATYLLAPTIVNLLVAAMLLVQAWRLFGQDAGWLKIIETVIGGFVVSLTASFIFEAGRDAGPYAFVVAPLVLFAAVICAGGMVLIWSDRIWLRTFSRRG